MNWVAFNGPVWQMEEAIYNNSSYKKCYIYIFGRPRMAIRHSERSNPCSDILLSFYYLNVSINIMIDISLLIDLFDWFFFVSPLMTQNNHQEHWQCCLQLDVYTEPEITTRL